jgi:hypothetical protein
MAISMLPDAESPDVCEALFRCSHGNARRLLSWLAVSVVTAKSAVMRSAPALSVSSQKCSLTEDTAMVSLSVNIIMQPYSALIRAETLIMFLSAKGVQVKVFPFAMHNRSSV